MRIAPLGPIHLSTDYSFAISLGVFRINRSCKPANPAFTMSEILRRARPRGLREGCASKLFVFVVVQVANGGADRDRTDDLKLAKLPLSQLSYGPKRAMARRNQKTEIGSQKISAALLISGF